MSTFDEVVSPCVHKITDPLEDRIEAIEKKLTKTETPVVPKNGNPFKKPKRLPETRGKWADVFYHLVEFMAGRKKPATFDQLWKVTTANSPLLSKDKNGKHRLGAMLSGSPFIKNVGRRLYSLSSEGTVVAKQLDLFK